MTFDNASPTVLLIDEQGDNDFLTRDWLEINGYRVCAAANVFDALEDMLDFTGEHRPSLIMLNSAMSAADCRSAMDSLHEFAEIPIVALTDGDGAGAVNSDEYFVAAENLETLKPLMISLLTDKRELSMTAATF